MEKIERRKTQQLPRSPHAIFGQRPFKNKSSHLFRTNTVISQNYQIRPRGIPLLVAFIENAVWSGGEGISSLGHDLVDSRAAEEDVVCRVRAISERRFGDVEDSLEYTLLLYQIKENPAASGHQKVDPFSVGWPTSRSRETSDPDFFSPGLSDVLFALRDRVPKEPPKEEN